MDLNSMLNPKRPDEDDRDNARRSASTQSQSRPSLPTLTTQPSTSSQGYHQRSNDAYPYTPSQVLHTPTPPPPLPTAHSRSSHGQYAQTPMTPGSVLHQQHPLQSPQLLHSPYAHSVTTPGGGQHAAPTHYFARQQSISQTSSSAQDYTPISQHRSPMSPHQMRPGAAPSLPQQPSYPGTPLGPPPSRGSMPPVGESPIHHRKPSQPSPANYTPGGAQYPQQPQQPSSFTNSPEARHQRPVIHRNDTTSTNGRERSVSVSPKTVVTSLPSARSDSVHLESNVLHATPERRSLDNTSAASLDSGHGFKQGQVNNQQTFSHYHNPSSQPLPQANAFSQPLSRPSPPRPDSIGSGPSMSAEMDRNGFVDGQQRRLKRERDSEETLEQSSHPTKRVKKTKPPPIWAQPRVRGQGPRAVASKPPPRLANGGSNVAAPRPAPASIPKASDEWEPSFTNTVPMEDIVKEVCDFFTAYLVSNPALASLATNEAGKLPGNDGTIEIEARLGKILEKGTHERITIPVRSETVLDQRFDVQFESQMTIPMHKAFNEYLNASTQQSRVPSRPGQKGRVPIEYAHLHEIDTFYELPASEMGSLPAYMIERYKTLHRKPKVRLTHDEKTNKLLACIIKVPIDHIHVFNPKYDFDWRISINAEMNWDGDVQALLKHNAGVDNQPERRKDRVSYKHLDYSIDLTQVKSAGTQSHELEVEVSSSRVRQLARKAVEGKGGEDFTAVVKGFVDNVRILSRLGMPPVQQR